MGASPTGHAGMGSKASVSPDWPIVFKTPNEQPINPFLDHLTTNDDFVLIENLNALHAGIKASQGSFSLPFDGWLVREGQKISIESATVAGDIKSVLNNIINIENNTYETHQGVSPHVWINELTVTGQS